MAIYHLTVKTVSRGDGVSVKGRFEYVNRQGAYESDADEVLYAENGNMPAWAASEPVRYWDSAFLYERANGRLFKQIEFALPRELNFEYQKAAAHCLAQAVTHVKGGLLPYSYAIHAGHGRGNPHVHIMVSERINDGIDRTAKTWFKRAAKDAAKGGAKKTTELMPKEWLFWLRESWEKIANAMLQNAGFDVRISCKTLEAQGIEREAQKHLGPARAAMERKKGGEKPETVEKTECKEVFFDDFEMLQPAEDEDMGDKENGDMMPGNDEMESPLDMPQSTDDDLK